MYYLSIWCCKKLILNVPKLIATCAKSNCIMKNNLLKSEIIVFANHFFQPDIKINTYYNKDKDHRRRQINFILGSSAMLFTLFSSEEASEKEKEPELITTIKRSILLIQREEFKKAEQVLHVALRQAQDLQNYNAITYIYDVMANLAFDTKNYSKAETLFLSVLRRLIANGTQQNDLKVIHISLKIAKIFEHKGEIQNAEHGYKFCLENLQTYLNDNIENEDALLLQAMTLDWYAQFLFSQSRYAESYKHFLEAYNLSMKIYGVEHEQTIILLNDLGTVSCNIGEHDQAIQYLSTAIEAGKNLPDMVDFGSLYINLGNVLIKKGLYEEARKSCKEGWRLSRIQKNDDSLKEAEKCFNEIKRLIS